MTQEALKLALEALENAVRYHGIMLMSDPPQDAWKYHKVEDKADKAITAIKEALALQALHDENERLGLYKDAYAEQEQEQEQEPVAWMYQEYRDDDQFGWRDEILFVQPPNDPNYFRNIVPVYTVPPQRTWVGLTVEEIAACCRESTTTQLSFYNNIEAKLKEKNT
jgi:hypothetical protein